MKNVRTLFILVGLALSVSAPALSAETLPLDTLPPGTLSPDEMKSRLNKIRPDLPIKAVGNSKLDGFYEVTLVQGTVLFVKQDASYFIAGDLYRIEETAFVNVSEESRNVDRKKLINEVPESEMLVFSPPPGLTKTSITVFTDLDCGYCRKLHKEVPELNRMGIEVRYLAYPRSGINTKSYDKYVSVWCADNSKLAFTQAKLGQDPETKNCDNPVAEQFLLGNKVGVTGTPAVVFEDGTLQAGYLPAEKMAARLGVN